MSTARKDLGVTVSLYLDGAGYGSTGITLSCEVNSDDQYKCPFMIAPCMPPEPGALCAYREGYTCRRIAASLDALKKAKSMISKQIKELEGTLE